MSSGSNMALEGCRQIVGSSEKSSSNKKSFRTHDLLGKTEKKLALEFLSQKRKTEGKHIGLQMHRELLQR